MWCFICLLLWLLLVILWCCFNVVLIWCLVFILVDIILLFSLFCFIYLFILVSHPERWVITVSKYSIKKLSWLNKRWCNSMWSSNGFHLSKIGICFWTSLDCTHAKNVQPFITRQCEILVTLIIIFWHYNCKMEFKTAFFLFLYQTHLLGRKTHSTNLYWNLSQGRDCGCEAIW